MTDKNADVVLTVVLTTAAEYSTLWEEKAKAAGIKEGLAKLQPQGFA